MRDKTREAMRLFLGGRCYTAEKLEKDYLAALLQIVGGDKLIIPFC